MENTANMAVMIPDEPATKTFKYTLRATASGTWPIWGDAVVRGWV